jgi:hypothetical protein
MSASENGLAELQARTDAILRRGIIFSILWLMGVGSAIAIYSGFKAKRLIASSSGRVTGAFKVWWCFIVGGLGIIIWGTVIAVGIYNNLK